MAEKNDYIKREDAELALGSMSMFKGRIFVEDALAKIADIPSADVVERKALEQMESLIDKLILDFRKCGEWIEEVGDCEGKTVIYRCSVCNDDDGWCNYNYCPNCGAKMKGAGE